MRKWLLLFLVLGVFVGLLVACGSKQNKALGSAEGLVPVPVAQATDVPPDSGFEPITPELVTRKGLTVLSQNEGTGNNRHYFYAEIRNDTNQYLSHIEAYIYPLDAYGYQLDTISASPLLTDIAPGQTFFVGREFRPPSGFVNTQRWIWFDTSTDQPRFKGYFNLPTTIRYRGVRWHMAYYVRGTATNNTGKNLVFPVVDVLLMSGNTPVGLCHAVVKTSSANGVWKPGEVVTYEAVFNYTAVTSGYITAAKVSATGYTIS
jgi:hypothetical protein